MTTVRFVDTTIRDGNASLWAGALRTDAILPVASQLDQAGFAAMEIVAPAFFKKMVRELKESPWERFDRIAALMPATPLRAILGRSISSFEHVPRSITQLYLQRLAAHGISEARVSDSSNTPAVWRQQVQDCRQAGLRVILNLVFSVSPIHTDDYYVRLTREAAALDVAAICLKDPSGLLTPERTQALAPRIVQEARGIPVEFHMHCNTGLGPLCVLDALRAGILIINTAIPPLANGSSNPSIFNVAHNASVLGFEPLVDLEVLRPVSDSLTRYAEREGLPIGIPLEYDESHFIQQVPGGMISNLRHQLGKIGILDRLPEVLDEIVRVRQDLGFPIMVTPYSQFVGVQATLNVMAGERYRQISDQVIQYALGLWGEAEANGVAADVRDKILSHARARELANWRPPEPSLEQIRQQLSTTADDELLLRYIAGSAAVDDLRAQPAPSSIALDAARPLPELIAELAKRPRLSRIHIVQDGLSLRMESMTGAG